MSSRRGNAAIEFALMLPVLMVVFAAVIDLSRYMSMTHLLSRTARDAARAGSMVIEGTNPTGDEIEVAATEQGDALLDASGYPCSGECEVEANWVTIGAYSYVIVTVTYPFVPVMGTLPFLARNVEATFTMMTQQQ